MSTGSISLDILLNQIRNDAMAKTEDTVKDIRRRYPSLSQKEAIEIHKMIVAASMGQQDETSLVVTAPPSFAIQSRVTKVVVDDFWKSITIRNSRIRCRHFMQRYYPLIRTRP